MAAATLTYTTPGIRRPAVVRRRRRAVYRRRRVAAALLAALVVALTVVAMTLVGSAPAGAQAPAQPALLVVVEPGDTVWDLARDHGPVGANLHDYVARVLAVNDVRGAELTPGSVLELPR